MPHLQYTGPDGVTQRFLLRHRITQIGSSRDCHLVLQGPDIAPSHCTLEHTAGSFKVESSSRSAVFFVAGKKLREHVLRHGDVLLLGNVEVTFSAVDPPAPAADPESAARLQIDAMRNLQRFSELLARAESSLDGLLSELIDQVVQGYDLPRAARADAGRAVGKEANGLIDQDVYPVSASSQGSKARFGPGDVAVVIGGPDVDDALEAAPELLQMVGEVRRDICRLAVAATHGPIALVGEGRRAQPESAVRLVGMAALLQEA